MRALLLLLTTATVAVLAFGLQAAQPAHAATTFTVNSTGDADDADTTDNICDSDAGMPDEQCTLRAAIQQANVTSGADEIHFSIPGSGVHTITPSSALPTITEPVTIDGYTQGDGTPDSSDDATENTILVARDGTNAKPLIELNGANVTSPSRNGLAINASNVEVRGLVINRFGGTGIFILGNGSGAKIKGNFIGTDPSGTQSLVGNGTGVTAFGGGANIIGGRDAAAHNLISGNNTQGLTIASNTGNTIQGNLIGTDKGGTNNLANATEGVGIGSSNNIIGSAAADNDLDSNLIAFNGGDGVSITGGTGNRILNNRIHTNGKLGINLVGGKEDVNGVTKNDGRAKDRDTGSNNLQNFPTITSARTEGGTTTIKGTLRSAPKKTFIVQLFSSPAADSPSGYGEGKEFQNKTEVTTNREGRGSFTFTTGDIRGEFVTVTATNNITGDTSEFSKACEVPRRTCS